MNINVGVITPDDNLRSLLVERFNYHLPKMLALKTVKDIPTWA